MYVRRQTDVKYLRNNGMFEKKKMNEAHIEGTVTVHRLFETLKAFSNEVVIIRDRNSHDTWKVILLNEAPFHNLPYL